MDGSKSLHPTNCKRCTATFTLPGNDEDDECNLPRSLTCGHIYCTTCLLAIHHDSVIMCPECQAESILPEGGVSELQEDIAIIGLLYTAKINKYKSLRKHKSKYCASNKGPTPADKHDNMDGAQQVDDLEKILDDALAGACENLAQLQDIQTTLTADLAEQILKKNVCLEMEVKQVVVKACHAINEWKDALLLPSKSGPCSRQETLSGLQERIKSLKLAMEKAKGILRVPDLEQYCVLDTILETLRAPVDKESFRNKCSSVDPGFSCIFYSEILNQNDSLLLKMEVTTSPVSPQLVMTRKPSTRKTSACESNKLERAVAEDASPEYSIAAGAAAPDTISFPQSVLFPEPESPDVIIEEYLTEHKATLPVDLELPPEVCKPRRREKNKCKKKIQVTMWVVVTHIVNPNHFYVRYISERRESEILSKKINEYCWRNSCRFVLDDMLETGSMIFAKWDLCLWGRATIVELKQHDCSEPVKFCWVNRLVNIKVFFVDRGLTRSISILSSSTEDRNGSTLTVVNEHLRKVDPTLNIDLHNVAPLAIGCSLKGLVPYDQKKGWSKEANIEFQKLVGSAALEMRPLAMETDLLLVDLRKVRKDGPSISVAEFLVFVEVARFHSPGLCGRNPLLFFPPIFPELNKEVNAVVSHINNPADFYIQLVEITESMLLSAKLNDCYSVGRHRLHLYCPSLGQTCVARFQDSWYRAEVIGFSADKRVQVRYVDFGNESSVPVTDLRRIKEEFFALPILAIQCTLAEVAPLDGSLWSEECTKRFVGLVHQKLVTVVATGPTDTTEPLQIQLFESSLYGPVANIATQLVEEGLACFKEELQSKDSAASAVEIVMWDPPVELDSAADVASKTQQDESEQQREEEEEGAEFDPRLKLPAHLKDLKVQVSHVNSPSSFYVQLAENSRQLKRLSELLKRECAHAVISDAEWLKANMYVAALNGAIWERGRVCGDVTSSGVVEVMRCDHGNTVKLDVGMLQPLPKHLEGSLALECSLTGIRPAGGQSSWTATACDFISDSLRGASALMTIQDTIEQPPVAVTLHFSNKMGRIVNTADVLVSHGLALKYRKPRESVGEQPKPTGVHSNTTQAGQLIQHLPKPRPRRFISAEMVQTESYHPPDLPGLGALQVTVSAIDDGFIYVRSQSADGQLEQLCERIQQHMKTLPQPKHYTWKSVQGCAVVGKDMLWHRGHLVEVLGEYLKVQYVDYGTMETIPMVHVYPTLLCDDVPQLCLPCQLHGLIPLGGKWQCDAVALMEELLLKRSVQIQLKELPTDPRGPVKVEVFLDSMSLSTIMCEHAHATIDPTASLRKEPSVTSPACLDEWQINTEGLREPKELSPGSFILPNLPEEGASLEVRVKHLLTPNELFLWVLDGEQDVEDEETLDEALTRVNTNIDSLPPLESFTPGSPCLAEYSDKKFYRAKLISIINVEPIEVLVHHVDFGSDDTLTVAKLRQMPAELLRFPVQVLKVKVAGLKPPSAGPQDCMLPYSLKWSMKAAMEMVDLLHGSITAFIVSCSPELTVELYNEDGELLYLPLLDSGLAELE